MIDLVSAQRIGAQHILLAVDESRASRKALEVAAQLAERSHGSVFVLHVRESQPVRRGVVATELREDAAELVNTVVFELRRKGIDAEGEVYTSFLGQVGGAIVDAARQLKSDLIVMGSSGRHSWIRRLLTGSVSRRVLKRAPVPVLLVR